MIKTLKWLSVVATLGMIFVLIGGALVTKTGSSMGCGASFPLCKGQILPKEIDAELIIELSHRLVTGIIGIAVILLAILAWKYLGHVREVKFLIFLSVFFLFLQAAIGAGAVLWGQSDFILATHFGISLIAFTAIFLLMLLIFEIDKKFDAKSLFIEKKHRIELYMLTAFTMIVVYTGALVRHVDANLVCPDWPFCHNDAPFSFPDYHFVQWVQMGHRLIAGILFIWTVIYFIKMIKNYRHKRIMFWGWIATLGLITMQVIFGALIIFTRLNLGIALLHALFISLYFSMLSYFVFLSSRSAKYKNTLG
ncbi:MAG TPA: heme A synthase [Virgibacillus sp.]|nr:heme A synthase [Virgibacillus sp.]